MNIGTKGFFMSNILPPMLIEMHFCVLLFHQNLEKELPGSKLLLCEEADFFIFGQIMSWNINFVSFGASCIYFWSKFLVF